MAPPPPGFEWDPEKARLNAAKHGISFELAVTIFDGWVFSFDDDRFDYGEVRVTAYGLCRGVEIMVVYTERSDRRRVISARRATRYERNQYWEAYRDAHG